jgi:hypothetical protein
LRIERADVARAGGVLTLDSFVAILLTIFGIGICCTIARSQGVNLGLVRLSEYVSYWALICLILFRVTNEVIRRFEGQPLGFWLGVIALITAIIGLGLSIFSIYINYVSASNSEKSSDSVRSLAPPAAETRSNSANQPPNVIHSIIDDSEVGKTFTDRDITYFFTEVQNRNSLQARSLIKPYVGMLMRFEARVQSYNINMAPGNLFFTVGMNVELPDSGSRFVMCRFSPKYEQFLARLDDKQLVALVGTITDELTPQAMTLNGCHPAK